MIRSAIAMARDRDHRLMIAMRAALAVSSVAWVWLAFTSDSVPRFSPLFWSLTAAVAGVATVVVVAVVAKVTVGVWFVGVASVGVVRSWAYATAEAWSPIGVWAIVVCLAVVAALALIAVSTHLDVLTEGKARQGES